MSDSPYTLEAINVAVSNTTGTDPDAGQEAADFLRAWAEEPSNLFSFWDALN
jgi:hypothetical protein